MGAALHANRAHCIEAIKADCEVTRSRLQSNLENVSRAHAADFAALGEAKKRIAELEAASQWRPIEEAPKEGTWLPMWTGYPRGWAKGHWWGFSESWADEDGEEIRPTHYMPAPPAPPANRGEI